jgi:hypothetical protein
MYIFCEEIDSPCTIINCGSLTPEIHQYIYFQIISTS